MTWVLVAYASKMGGTRGIAEAIAERLCERGLRAEALDMREVRSVEPFDAVVLGSAVYTMRWRPEAVKFVRHYQDELRARRVWLFESGWVGTRPATLAVSPSGARCAARIEAAKPTLFGGRLDPTLPGSFLYRKMAQRMPGDSRDFDEIRGWADSIADALVTPQGPVR